MAPKVVPINRISGAAMDQPLPKRQRNLIVVAACLLLPILVAAAFWQLVPRGLRVAEMDLRIATVRQDLFRNDLVMRASAEPLHSVMLDAFQSGRVEEVLARDGELVAQGALLFRLSNPQLRLELVAREADRAQQISNLSILRVAIESGETEHRRRLLDQNFALAQARKQHARLAPLAKEGVVSAAALEESLDRVARETQALEDEQTRFAVEARIKRDGAKQMERAIERLDAGLKVVNESIDGLAVRAPIAGRLTDFHLQLGEIVKSDQHIGRIDQPGAVKLAALVDEFFLDGLAAGKEGMASVNGRDYPVVVSRVFPQVANGRFSIELLFVNDAPADMSPGQSTETRITLGETSPGLILPNDSFVNDTGGAWVFVLSPDGRSATRRTIRTGRRNNRQVEIASGLAAGERVIVSNYGTFGKVERLQIAR
ncbi:MAG TPA: HlyD family efflux transporter periplasmic adaptor subunit [Steroidobacteraceae bacterium]|nr:HlyD family efflux transporter periplasmic adaptor subunit [Steroidobacteraceae bacterium]